MLTFLDVETTGLNPELGHGICEIALVSFSWGGKVISRYVRLIRPRVAIPEKVSAIHGITPEMVETAVPFGEVAEEVEEILRSSNLVLGYNIKFDLDFLRVEFDRIGRKMPPIQYIDVLEVARRLLPGRRSYKLSSLARALGFESQGFHWAEDDVRATAYVFFRLLNDTGLGREEISNWVRRY